jgi:hypothetical protein
MAVKMNRGNFHFEGGRKLLIKFTNFGYLKNSIINLQINNNRSNKLRSYFFQGE